MARRREAASWGSRRETNPPTQAKKNSCNRARRAHRPRGQGGCAAEPKCASERAGEAKARATGVRRNSPEKKERKTKRRGERQGGGRRTTKKTLTTQGGGAGWKQGGGEGAAPDRFPAPSPFTAVGHARATARRRVARHSHRRPWPPQQRRRRPSLPPRRRPRHPRRPLGGTTPTGTGKQGRGAAAMGGPPRRRPPDRTHGHGHVRDRAQKSK